MKAKRAFSIATLILLLTLLTIGLIGCKPESYSSSRYALVLISLPGDGGTIQQSPLPDADGKYTAGTRVKFEARNSAGFSFVRWSGDAQGTLPSITITMDRDKSITAEFSKNSPSPPPSTSTTPTPSTMPLGQFRAEYFSNPSLSGDPIFTRNENSINYDWGSGGPGNGIGNDNFSVRWTGRFSFSLGTYIFIARADDGIRIWVDGNSLIDNWRDNGVTEYRASCTLAGGVHEVKMEYYEAQGSAVAQLRWNGQFRAEYYNNASLSGNPTIVTNEDEINHDWGDGGPGKGIGNDNFSARWTGRFYFSAGIYTFIARTDDGMRVWVDGHPIIDAWKDQAVTEYRQDYNLTDGEHEVKVEYYEKDKLAVAQLRWERPASPP